MKLDNDQFAKILMLDLENGIVPFLAGEPGIGKSSIVKTLARDMGSKVFVVMCNQMADKADLTGARLMPTQDGSFEQQFFPHHKVKAAVDYARANKRDWVLLMLDEINRTTPDVTSAALTISTERELGNEVLPENLKIIVAGNVKGNVTALDEASLSRFAIYNVEPDAAALINVFGDKINASVKNVLTKHPETVFEKSKGDTLDVADGDDDDKNQTVSVSDLFESGEEMLQLTTPRTIEFANNWLNSADDTLITTLIQTQVQVNGRDMTMLQEILEGKLGNTSFTKYLVDEVMTAQQSGTQTAAPTIKAVKPRCYADLQQVTTIDDLDDAIQDLTDKERSGSLVYALSENRDNQQLIQQLASAITADIEREHLKNLVQLASNSMLDDDNVSALFATNTAVGNKLQHTIGALMAV